MANPSSQKADARPISFILDDQNTGERLALDLAIRPEDLTRNEPQRITVTQTLGGAFADNFGDGIHTITLSGHTGWNAYADGRDGIARFQQLHDRLFKDWGARRAQAARDGKDPEKVLLLFADGLDDKVDVVLPTNFQLRRNKQRPLLAQYNINLTAMGIAIDFGSKDPLKNLISAQDILSDLGLQSLGKSLDFLEASAESIGSFVDANVAGPIKGFMDKANGTIRKTQMVLGAVKGAVDRATLPLVNLATDVAKAGTTMFQGLSAIAAFPNVVKAQFMQIGSAFSNCFCVLRNAFRRFLNFPDFSNLFGSSNCSSTSGGRPLSPLSGKNPFEKMYPKPSATSGATQNSRDSLSRLAGADHVVNPPSLSSILADATRAATGIAA